MWKTWWQPSNAPDSNSFWAFWIETDASTFGIAFVFLEKGSAELYHAVGNHTRSMLAAERNYSV